MKRTNQALGLVVIALALATGAGCSHDEAPSHAASAPALAAPAASNAPVSADQPPGAGAPLAAGQALIVTMELKMTTSDVRAATARIRGEVERAGGYVSDATESGSDEARTADIEVRVPTDRTKGLRESLASAGQIYSDVEKVEDVTEQRADLKARLQNARVQEKRVLEIMSHKSSTIGEVLEAERELSRVRESIERLEAQERSMEGKIALATVKIHVGREPVVTEPEPEAWRTPGKSILRAGGAGLRAAAALGVYAAMAIAASAPITIPVGAIVAIAIAFARKRKREQLRALGAC
ncbi:MAG: DUF4349 domain-containing protein [Labilithrix sp.]|nr:DUF4349 domain-containing protein [Labilithrix sp.]